MRRLCRILTALCALTAGHPALAASAACSAARALEDLYVAMEAVQATDGRLGMEEFQELLELKRGLDVKSTRAALAGSEIGGQVREALIPLLTMETFQAIRAGDVVIVGSLQRETTAAQMSRALSVLRSLDCRRLRWGDGPLAALGDLALGLGDIGRTMRERSASGTALTPQAGTVTLLLLIAGGLGWHSLAARRDAQERSYHCRLPIGLYTAGRALPPLPATAVAISRRGLKMRTARPAALRAGTVFDAAIADRTLQLRILWATDVVIEARFGRPLSADGLAALLAVSTAAAEAQGPAARPAPTGERMPVDAETGSGADEEDVESVDEDDDFIPAPRPYSPG